MRKIRNYGLAAILLFAFWQGFSFLKNHQANRLLNLAEEFESKGKREDAILSLITASRLHPNSPEILSRLGDAAAKMELHSIAYVAFRGIRDARDLSLLEQRAFILQSAKLAQPVSLRRAKNHLVARCESPLLSPLLDADMKSTLGDFEGADLDLQAAAKQDGGLPSPIWIRTNLLEEKPIYADQENFLVILDEISSRFPEPNPKPLDDATLAWKRPSTRAIMASELVQKYRTASLSDRTMVASWLLFEKRPVSALSLLTEEDAAKSNEALAIWCDAQLANGSPEAVQRLLDRQDITFPPHLRTLLGARTLQRSGDVEGSKALYKSAYELAKKDPELLSEVLLVLAKEGQTSLLESSFAEVAKNPALSGRWFEKILIKSKESRDSEVVLRLLQSADKAGFSMGSPTLQSEKEYLEILLGRSTVSKALETRARQKADSPSLLMPYLASLVASNQAPKALRELKKYPVDINARALAPRHQAVLAWVFVKNNRPKDALRIASLIPPHSLSLQEEFILEKMIGKKESPSPEQNLKK